MIERKATHRRSSLEAPVGLASLSFGRRGALWLVLVCAGVCLLALFLAWYNRYEVYTDGLTYLDMASAIVRGDLATAVNATFSPLYPALLAVILRFLRPSGNLEAPAVHALNFLLFVGAAIAFAAFVKEIAGINRRPPGQHEHVSSNRQVAGSALALVAAVLFSETILGFVGVQTISPDICVAMAFFMATALLIRLGKEPARIRRFAMFGAALGVGYFAKAIFFPLAFVFLTSAFWSTTRKEVRKGVVVSLAVFLALAAPWIVVLSISKGRLTFGDVGRLNYAWDASGVAGPPGVWLGAPEGSGFPVHPPHRLEADPDIFDFGEPLRVTYPVWYDPSYWYEGLRIQPNWKRQAAAIAANVRWYAHALAGIPWQSGPVITGVAVWGLVVLLYVGGLAPGGQSGYRLMTFSLLPAVVALCLYLLVHVEARYVGPMIAVALVIAFGAIRLPHSAVTGRLVNGITVVMLLAWAGKAGVMLAHRIHDEHGGYVGAGRSAGYRWPLEVSESLGRMGVAPGTMVAFVGYSTRFYWARLAGVRIVSELRDPKQVQRFWLRDQASRERILNAFRRAGATVVVTEAVPPDSSVWTSLGSGFEARWLRSGDGHVRDLLREAPAEEVTEVR